jgi:hypothetical protein
MSSVSITIADTANIDDLAVTTAKIAAAAVTTAKIADSNVTTAKIADSNVTTAKIADNNVTKGKLAALGHQISASSGSSSSASTSYIDVPNLSVTITTTGRPVMILFISDGSGNPSRLWLRAATDNANNFYAQILRGASVITTQNIQVEASSLGAYSDMAESPASLNQMDFPAAGTYTYKLQAKFQAGNIWNVEYVKMVVFEL